MAREVQVANDVNIRRARAADCEALLRLADIIFAETGAGKAAEVNPQYWHWQYGPGPAGESPIWLAEAEDRVVAQFPSQLVRVGWRERELLGAAIVDLMVEKRYRKRTPSLYVELATRASAEFSRQGIALSFGLPNHRALPSAIRFLKYRVICQLPVLFRPLAWRRLLQHSRYTKALGAPLRSLLTAGYFLTVWPPRVKGLSVERVTEFPEEVNALWQQAAAVHTIASIRDHAYLSWRYCACPTRKYSIYLARRNGQLCGYLVTRTLVKNGAQLGAVMDMLTAPGEPQAAHALAAAAMEELSQQQVEAVVAVMQAHHPHYAALKRWGFLRIPERFNPRPFNFVVKLHRTDLPLEDFCSPRNWYLTLGDYDVY